MDRFKIMAGAGLLALFGSASSLAQERSNPIAELDTDGDEQVNFEEFLAGDLPLLSSLDSDENGVVTLDEFLNARPGRGASRRGDDDRPEREIDEERAAELQERMLQRAEERFATMDLDGDEMITELELKEATFLQLDRDGDGLLSAREMRPRRGPGMRGGQGRGHGGTAGRRGNREQADEE